MTLVEIIAECRARASQTVPFAGMALGDLKRGASYTAAKNGVLGVPVFWSGGKLRTASIDILKRLGVEPEAPAKINQPAETTPVSAVAAPAVQLAVAPKPAPTKPRKPPATKTIVARKPPARATTAPRKPIKSKSVAAE